MYAIQKKTVFRKKCLKSCPLPVFYTFELTEFRRQPEKAHDCGKSVSVLRFLNALWRSHHHEMNGVGYFHFASGSQLKQKSAPFPLWPEMNAWRVLKDWGGRSAFCSQLCSLPSMDGNVVVVMVVGWLAMSWLVVYPCTNITIIKASLFAGVYAKHRNIVICRWSSDAMVCAVFGFITNRWCWYWRWQSDIQFIRLCWWQERGGHFAHA